MDPPRDSGASQHEQEVEREQEKQSRAASLPPPSLVAIDDLLDAASSALPPSGLLHGPLFSLHDAMLAVEVGDPKLDAGARGGGGHETNVDGENLTATATTAPSPLLSPGDALQVFDGLVLAAEAAWHAGGCLGTTIGTCVFVLRPRLLKGRGGGGEGEGKEKEKETVDDSLLLLRALTAATRASVSATRSLVTRAGVSEDEDFQLFQQALPTEGEGGEEEDADELLERAERMLSSPRPPAPLGLSIPPTGEQASSLRRRLRFRRATLRAMRTAEALGGGGKEGRRSSSAPSDLSDLASSVSEALEALGEIEKERGKREREEKETGGDAPSSSLPLPWFDAAAARSELPPAPPRPDRRFDATEGAESWRKLLEDLGAVASFPESVAREEGDGAEAVQRDQESRVKVYHLRGALRAVRAFALRGAGAVPRSALALVLGLALDANPAAAKAKATAEEGSTPADGDDGDGDENDGGGGGGAPGPDDGGNPYVSEGAVKNALHILFYDPILRPPPPSDGGGGAERTMSPASKFVEQATLGVQGWCVAALLNPARSRRRHRRCCEDWGHVHEHALNAEADEAFREWLEAGSGGGGEDGDDGEPRRRLWDWSLPAPSTQPLSPTDAAIEEHASMLSCWVEEQACRAERDHLLSGFALDLYSPSEAASVLLVAEHLERRGEGAAGALAERCPLAVYAFCYGDGEASGGKKASGGKRGKGNEKRDDVRTEKRDDVRTLLFPMPSAVQAEVDSRACAARKYVAGALLRAAAATMAESVAVPVEGTEGGESSFAPRVPSAPRPFNSPRDGFDARFSGGPLSKLTTPPRVSYDDYDAAVGEALRTVSENNRKRFSGVGGRDGGDGLTALALLRLAKDACLLARKALPDLAAPSNAPWGKLGTPRLGKGKRALSADDERALSRVLATTAVSLGILEKEEAEAEEKAKGGRLSSIEPSRLVVSWDASIHPLYPALRVRSK